MAGIWLSHTIVVLVRMQGFFLRPGHRFSSWLGVSQQFFILIQGRIHCGDPFSMRVYDKESLFPVYLRRFLANMLFWNPFSFFGSFARYFPNWNTIIDPVGSNYLIWVFPPSRLQCQILRHGFRSTEFVVGNKFLTGKNSSIWRYFLSMYVPSPRLQGHQNWLLPRPAPCSAGGTPVLLRMHGRDSPARAPGKTKYAVGVTKQSDQQHFDVMIFLGWVLNCLHCNWPFITVKSWTKGNNYWNSESYRRCFISMLQKKYPKKIVVLVPKYYRIAHSHNITIQCHASQFGLHGWTRDGKQQKKHRSAGSFVRKLKERFGNVYFERWDFSFISPPPKFFQCVNNQDRSIM